MALTVIQQPKGHVLNDVSIAATISSSAGALFTATAHGLNTADTIYIYSAISDHNGYWYVSVVSANTFRIREYATASDKAFIKTGSVTCYKSMQRHYWNCVHLPIIYKLKSDVWPTNGVDSAKTITTFSNYNGYTYIVANGDIKVTGTASSLEQVILAGTSVNGVYKILQWFSDTNFVIDLAYSGSNVLSSGTVQYYYYNYNARIRIYAGLPPAHYWAAQKPSVLITEVRCIPDSTGVITLNIADYIKQKIEVIKNNSLLATLPNNIDAWCSFYITYAESYDDSNMYTVAEYIGTYKDDSYGADGTEAGGAFTGYAVNAKLPFKTMSSGFLSPYVSVPSGIITTKSKWLTAFARPTMWADKYFDVSFIKNTTSAGDYIKRDVYTFNGVTYTLRQTYIDVITDNDEGIYRYSIDQSGWNEDRIDITYYNVSNDILSETLTIDVIDECTNQDFYMVWLNYLGGYDYWNFTARKQYSIATTESKTQEQNIFNNWPNSYGEFADSIVKQTVRRGMNVLTISSQLLTTDQEDAIKLLFVSPLVQICTSQYDRRTLLVQSGSLPVRRDQDKTRKLSFGVSYTDELPSQSL